MKYFVVTDIHGSYAWAERVLEKFVAVMADKLVILGDLYYHGPRNPLPEGYAPMDVAKLLNANKDKIIAIRGNCDADIDQTISEFKLNKSYSVKVDGHKIFFTHGDKYNKDCLPKLKGGDVLIYGHFHVDELTDKNGVACVNVASVSLPKNNSKPSYAVIDEGGVAVSSFDDEVVFKYSF